MRDQDRRPLSSLLSFLTLIVYSARLYTLYNPADCRTRNRYNAQSARQEDSPLARLSSLLYMIPLRTLSPRSLLSRSKMSASTSSSSPSTLRQRTTPSSPSARISTSASQLSPPHSHGHSHSHSHSHGSHTQETAVLSSAFSSLRSPSSLDPGSRITLIGLFSNVGLTALKGVAGYVLASSALLADAAHSGSDLIADVVTLASYRVGRWKPSEKYPYGYGST